jgi:hypothetical protein
LVTRDRDQDRTLGLIIGLTNSVIIVLGVGFGIIGLIGGMRRGAWETIVLAVIGCLLNGMLFLAIIASFIAAKNAAERMRRERGATISAPLDFVVPIEYSATHYKLRKNRKSAACSSSLGGRVALASCQRLLLDR